MKTVVISDIQLHNHQKWATITEEGLNSRLMDGIRTLDQARELAKDGILIVSGDFFHDSRAISIDVLSEASKWVERASADCRWLILAVGNHDHFRKSGTIHSLEPFRRQNVIVVDDIYSEGLRSGGKDIVVAPYYEDCTKLAEWLRKVSDEEAKEIILILHQDVKGGVMNGGRISEEGLALKELERFHLVLLGHFHEHQRLAPNVFYVGSPYQIDKGEMGQPKFIAVIEHGEVEWVPTEGVPEYRVVSYEQFRNTGDYGVHFWEVLCDDFQREQMANQPPVGANYRVVGIQMEVAGTEEEDRGSLTVQGAVMAELLKVGRLDLEEVALSRLD